MSKNIVIAGAGLVGSLLTCYLAKRGHKVTVFERRPDMRKSGYVGGRSINLALSDRGWRALEKIGLREAIERIAIPMRGRMVHDLDNTTHFLPYGQDDQAIYSVSRGELNLALINEAEKYEKVKFYFNQRVGAVDFERTALKLENTIEEKGSNFSADYILGADGGYSELRFAMLKSHNFNYSQTHEEYGYKELHIPAGADGAFLTEKNALHIWPRKNFMMIALPNIDGSFTCTLFAPFKGENSFESVKTENDVRDYFARNFPSAIPLMPTYVEDFMTNPTSSLVTVKCYPWRVNNVCLIGDAAHAIVPFYGQGMNCGFEDVRVLDELLDETKESWSAALSRFQQSRKPNSDAIADLALYNFVEMRDLSGQPAFQTRMALEKKIAARFPDKFMTRYSMVTFSHLPYSEAQARARKQDELLDALMQLPNIAEQMESEAVMKQAGEWIAANA